MPNWVSNSLSITGSKKELQRFAEQARKPYKRKHQELTDDGFVWVDGESGDSELSFWNFVKPDDYILDEYWGEERRDLSFWDQMKFATNHWYDWNIRNWGVKWDASRVSFEVAPKGICYDFETAYAVPLDVFQVMNEQYPTLVLDLTSVEERGWGCEYIADEDGVRNMREWDIPGSHNECMDNVDYCRCEDMDDDELEWAYYDCPRRIEKEGKDV
jgi:hypothetical protein